MKRMLLIAVALCCMVAVSAQEKKNQPSLKEKVKKVEQLNRQTNGYTQKLDSIVNDNNTKVTFMYDNYLRRTNMKLIYGTSMIAIDQNYIYDDAGHLISTTSEGLYYKEKIEYSYNALGQVAEEIEYDWSGDDWHLDYRTNYEYDTQGHVTKALQEEYEEGSWINFRKTEYNYTLGRLIKVMEYSWGWDGDFWWERGMEEYSYDGAGNCISLIEKYTYPNMDWFIDEKYEYEYDNHNNCIKETEYDYSESDGYTIDEIIEYNYDASVPSSTIAGYDEIFENMVIELKSKLTKVVENTYEDGELDESVISILYYSKGSQVAELPTATMTVSPNPASMFLNIQAEDLRQVEIFSMDGKMVMRLDQGVESVNVSTLATGTYLLKATKNDGSVVTQKFMKQ